MYIYVPVMSNNFFLKYKDAKRILEKHVKVNKHLPFITNIYCTPKFTAKTIDFQ